MGKALLTLFLCTVLMQQSISQLSFPDDIDFRPFLQRSINNIDSAFHLEKDNEFEFRLWVSPALSHRRYCFILTLKEKKWIARLFLDGYKPYQDSLVTRDLQEINIEKDNLDILVKELEKNNYLLIPSPETLVNKEGKPADVPVLDGVLYHFELIGQKSKRSYSYQCPALKSEEYGYIKEFRQVVNIISAVLKFCNIKDHRIC
jgi:hypothetical protein